jgi:hypothetical protein
VVEWGRPRARSELGGNVFFYGGNTIGDWRGLPYLPTGANVWCGGIGEVTPIRTVNRSVGRTIPETSDVFDLFPYVLRIYVPFLPRPFGDERNVRGRY